MAILCSSQLHCTAPRTWKLSQNYNPNRSRPLYRNSCHVTCPKPSNHRLWRTPLIIPSRALHSHPSTSPNAPCCLKLPTPATCPRGPAYNFPPHVASSSAARRRLTRGRDASPCHHVYAIRAQCTCARTAVNHCRPVATRIRDETMHSRM